MCYSLCSDCFILFAGGFFQLFLLFVVSNPVLYMLHCSDFVTSLWHSYTFYWVLVPLWYDLVFLYRFPPSWKLNVCPNFNGFFCSFFCFGPINLFSFCEEMFSLQHTGMCSTCPKRFFFCYWGMWFDCINCCSKVDS